jgi:hypothetical protein
MADITEFTPPDAATIKRCALSQAAKLLERVPELHRSQALSLAHAAIKQEVERGRFDADWSMQPLCLTLIDAKRVARAGRIAKHSTAIAAIYERARRDMEAIGEGFPLLVAWHRGER